MEWTDERIRVALKVLRSGEHQTVQSAIGELSKKLKSDISRSSMRHAFHRHEMKDPSTYLVTPHRRVDPIREYEHKSREKKFKSEHSDLVERLRDAESRHRFLDSISRPTRPVRIPRRETKSGIREGTAVVLASDWHVEENVRPESVAGRNTYNLKIAEARAGRFFSGIEWLLGFGRQEFTLRDVILWLGGDLITGYIHEELAEDNSLSPVEAVLFVKRVLTEGIHRLLQDPKLETLTIPCSFGNHGRTTPKRRIKTGAKNSFEWLLYNVLQQDFANEKRVRFVVDQSAHQYVEAYDFNLHFHHGDEVKYGGGIGGLTIPLNKRVFKWDNVRRADYHHVGHFHQLTDLGHTLVNGSLIGYSEYALSIGADYEPPQQGMYVLDSKRGKCMNTPIWVDEATGK
jgi:hypothetical protein